MAGFIRQTWKRFDQVVAVGVQTFHFDDRLNAARFASAFDEYDEVDCLSDQAAWNRDDGFLHKLFQAVERCSWGVRMYRGDAARMAGIPCLQQIKRLGTPHFTHNNAVGTQSQGRAHEVGEACDTRLRS